MRTNTNHWKLFRRRTAAGVVLLLVLAGAPVAEAGWGFKFDWSKVQAVSLGTPTTVVLYKDQAPPGKRKIKGHFRSATSRAITLLLPDGQTRTLQKKAVRKVLVPRPLKKRYQEWITLAVAFGVTQMLVNIDGASPSEVFGSHAALTAPVTVIAFLVAPKRGEIYNVPLKHRDHANTKTAPSQQHSGTTVPGVREEGGESHTGSELAGNFLTEQASPDRLRQQARRALMRKGLPLQLPDLSVPSLSAERSGAGVQTDFDGVFLREDGVPPLVGKPSSDWLRQARQPLMQKGRPLDLSSRPVPGPRSVGDADVP